MAYITNFLFCESIDIADGKPQVGDIVPLISVQGGKFSFSLLFSIAKFSNTEDHTGYLVINNPIGEEVVRTEPFFLEKRDSHEDSIKTLAGTTIGMDFDDVPYQGSGLYRCELHFDDKLLGEFHIPVIFNDGEE